MEEFYGFHTVFLLSEVFHDFWVRTSDSRVIRLLKTFI